MSKFLVLLRAQKYVAMIITGLTLTGAGVVRDG